MLSLSAPIPIVSRSVLTFTHSFIFLPLCFPLLKFPFHISSRASIPCSLSLSKQHRIDCDYIALILPFFVLFLVAPCPRSILFIVAVSRAAQVFHTYHWTFSFPFDPSQNIKILFWSLAMDRTGGTISNVFFLLKFVYLPHSACTDATPRYSGSVRVYPLPVQP